MGARDRGFESHHPDHHPLRGLVDISTTGKEGKGRELNDTTKKVAGTVVGLVVAGGVILGGWEAGWWFTQQNVNRQGHVIRNSYGNQQTLRDQITTKLGDVTSLDSQIAAGPSDVAQLKAQRQAVASIVCNDAEQVSGDPLPTDQAQWVSQNCEMGSAK